MTDQHTKVLVENLRFESSLGELSTELLNLPIESSMKMLVEFSEADRRHLGAFSGDQSKIVSYFISRAGISIPQITNVGEHYLSLIKKDIKILQKSIT